MATGLAHSLRKKKKKTTQTTLDTRTVESKPGKAKKKKSFSANIFSLLIYHAHIWGGWRWNGRVSDFSAGLFFSARSSIAGIFIQEVKAKWAHAMRSRFAKRPKLAAKGRGEEGEGREAGGGGISQTSAGYLWEAFVQADALHEQHHARLYCGHGRRCVFAEDEHLWRTKKPLCPCCLEAAIIQQGPRLHSSLSLHSGLVTRRQDKWLS